MLKQRTLTDDDTGKTYILISRPWARTIGIFISIIFTAIVALIVYTLSYRSLIKDIEGRVEIQRQRNLASDDMSRNRVRIQQWTYNQVCDITKEKGQKCLDNPTWWADPAKYPALFNDASGTGLFPPQEQQH